MTSLGDPTVLTYTTEEVKAEIALKSVLEQIKRVTSEDPIVSVIPESDLPPESRSAEIPIHTRLFQEMRERKAETIQAREGSSWSDVRAWNSWRTSTIVLETIHDQGGGHQDPGKDECG